MSTILVVDDDPSARGALRMLLGRAGYQTREAADVREALQVVDGAIDAAVLDYNLPDGTGHELCRAMRERSETRHIPVMILTARRPDASSHIEGYDGGADMYVHRPFDNDELLSCIRAMLRVRAMQMEVVRQNRRLRELSRLTQAIAAAGGIPEKLRMLGDSVRALLGSCTVDVVMADGTVAVGAAGCETISIQTPAALLDGISRWVSFADAASLAKAVVRAVQLNLKARATLRVTFSPPQILDENDLWLLETLCGHAAAAMESDALAREVATTQAQLIQADKMAALGVLVSGVAHELNNPLAGIMGLAQIMQAALECDPSPERFVEDLQKLEREARRAASIVASLLSFARKSHNRLEALDLRVALDEVVEMRRYAMNVRNIGVEISRTARPIPVMGVRNHLQQVFLNLIVNAEQAMFAARGRGTLRIAARVEKDAAVLTFGDDGPGIPPETLATLFQPFATSKESGTGLGLYISRSLIKDHQGMLYVESTTSGTTFTIRLPLAPAQAEQPALPPSPPRVRESHSDGLSILLVDDEPTVLESMRRMLGHLGCRGHACRDPREALNLLLEESFDGVFSDLKMPGMSGKEFFLALCAQNPELSDRIVFVSGDSASAATQAFLKDSGAPFVPMPFSLAQVREAVRALETRIGAAAAG